MTEVYLVRHCECEANIEQRLAGHYDYAITEKGAKQLDALAERFRAVRLDTVYASPLSRTRATAAAIARYNGAPVVLEEGFIEVDCGRIDGVKMTEQPDEIRQPWFHAPHLFAAPGGESFREVADRAWSTLQRIVRENPDKTVAVATHGCLLRNLNRILRRLPEDQLVTVRWSGNTSVHLIRFTDEENWEYLLENDTSHVPQEFAGPLERRRI